MKRPPSVRMSNSRRLFWVMIFGMMIAGGILALALFLFTPDAASANQLLPVSMRSGLSAKSWTDKDM